MKSVLNILGWTFVAVVIIFATANPENGIVYQSPMATLGIGMIGLGLCIEARKRLRTSN